MAIAITWLVVVVVVVVVVVAIATWRLGWERYRPRDAGRVVPTDEVLVDPETGRRQRVHMNPATGARVYVDEPRPPAGSHEAP
jgi:uncharacterized membrane protein YqiK